MIDKFNKGEDIYIYSAKLYLGDKFDKLDKNGKKMWRKRFKTIFLGRNAVYSSDIIEDKWTKTVNGENPNPVLRLKIARGFNLV